MPDHSEPAGILPSVLIVSNLFPPDIAGGAEIVASRQALALKERGCRVEVFAGFRPKAPAEAGSLNTETWNGLRVHRLGLRSLSGDDNFSWDLASSYFDAVLRQGEFDIVHFHNIMGLGVKLIEIARRHGCYAAVTVHDNWGFCIRSTRLRDDYSICENFEECFQCQRSINFETRAMLPIRLRRDYIFAILATADRLIFPSRSMAEVYAIANFDKAKMSVISNGIDHTPFSTVKFSAQKVRFLSLMYLGEHKGVLVLLEALRLLAMDKALNDRWVFRLAGDGHLESFVQAEASSIPLRGRLEYLGRLPQEDIPRLYQDTDVLVLASIWPENEPVTLLEAVSTGTAQLATRVGGHSDLIAEGITGDLINPGDAVALAEAMRRYIVDPNLAQLHGLANAERRHLFDEDLSIELLLSLYFERADTVTSTPDAGIVVCVGADPLPYARTILEHWHDFAPELNSVRFVSDAWWTADRFSEAKAIWFWDEDIAPDLLIQALRSGRPVLAPYRNGNLVGLRHLGAPFLVYEDGLGAFSLLKALLSDSALWPLMAGAGIGAHLLAESTSSDSFVNFVAQS